MSCSVSRPVSRPELAISARVRIYIYIFDTSSILKGKYLIFPLLARTQD